MSFVHFDVLRTITSICCTYLKYNFKNYLLVFFFFLHFLLSAIGFCLILQFRCLFPFLKHLLMTFCSGNLVDGDRCLSLPCRVPICCWDIQKLVSFMIGWNAGWISKLSGICLLASGTSCMLFAGISGYKNSKDHW